MSLKVLIAGGSGFLGEEIGLQLTKLGHRIAILTQDIESVRGQLAFPCQLLQWDYRNYSLPQGILNEFDVIINLCGKSLDSTKWDKKGREQILTSRVKPTESLLNALRTCQNRKIFIQASAVGYYGNDGQVLKNESAVKGKGFLADVCAAWEQPIHSFLALHPSSHRISILRIAPVLGFGGGFLNKLDALYSSGLGSQLGDGKQYLPWIHHEDLARLIVHIIKNQSAALIYNGCSPNAVDNATFHQVYAEVKGTQTLPPAPSPLLKIVLGAKNEMVLDSIRSLPTQAVREGFKFKYPTLAAALANIYQDQVDKGVSWFKCRQWINRPLERVWDFFSDERNLEKITPEFLKFKINATERIELGEGSQVNYQLKWHGIPMNWTTLIKSWHPQQDFIDVQIKGPYQLWHHHHQFQKLAGGTLMTDVVQYRLPLGKVGALVAGNVVSNDVQRIFEFRRMSIAHLFTP